MSARLDMRPSIPDSWCACSTAPRNASTPSFQANSFAGCVGAAVSWAFTSDFCIAACSALAFASCALRYSTLRAKISSGFSGGSMCMAPLGSIHCILLQRRQYIDA